MTSAYGFRERRTAETSLAALAALRRESVETTSLPLRDQIEAPVTSPCLRTDATSRRRVLFATRTRCPRTSIGARTASVYTETSRALSASACSRRLFDSTDESTTAPTVRIAADASRKVQSKAIDLKSPAER
ncbi:hypothetical protein BH09ACT13_BH09ACT13_04390 [soil metagenome]